MKKLTKRLIAIFSAVVVVTAVSSVAVSATDINEIVLTEVPTDNSGTEITPSWSATKTVVLDSTYRTVMTDNNLFEVALRITNNSSNLGDISVRVVDERGEVIVSGTVISTGKTGTVTIPSNAGYYSLEAKVTSSPRTYSLNITDGYAR